MSILEFLLVFIMLVLIGSGAIVGWFIVTRGQWEVTPDGKWKKTGMIFKYWSLFWEQYRKTKLISVAGEGLTQRYDLLKKTFPSIAQKFLHMGGGLKLKDGNMGSISGSEVKQMEDLLLCKITWFQDTALLRMEEPAYDWPEWIQKPFSSCPTCMAGPYGSVIWLVFLKLQRGAFGWADYPIFAKFAFGCLFLLTLALCNTYLKQKLKL